MAALAPIYTPGNCRPAYQLTWSLTVFWRPETTDAAWLDPLQRATEPDGVRILEHRFVRPGASQFLLSTTPQVSPLAFIRSVKGRLQRLVRRDWPRAFPPDARLCAGGIARGDRAAVHEQPCVCLGNGAGFPVQLLCGDVRGV